MSYPEYEPTWESLQQYTVPQWYQDAKFGIFIHWGVYSVPAFGNEWYPHNMYRQGTPEYQHHLNTYGPQNQFGYKDFIPLFTAERFDPHAWAELFQKAGARYVVPVAEHHDGFAMYDTSLSMWNAARMGPHRDILGELAQAIRCQGMIFGLSSHRAEHWWFFKGGRSFPSDVQDSHYADFYGPAALIPDDLHNLDVQPRPDGKFLDDWLKRCCELVDKYQPQLFWFDWWIEQVVFEPYRQKFAAYYYNRGIEWNLGVAINYKNQSFPPGTAVWDIERGQLKDIAPFFWQTDTSISKNSWGYIHNHIYKTATDLIGDLVDIVSKNGTLLLNVGPRPDGTIPEEEQDILLEIGRWLAINGEAVYATRSWKVFGEGPTQVGEGSFKDTARNAFTSQDMRFTTRENHLYAILLGWPGKEAAIRCLGIQSGFDASLISQISMLGSPQPLIWRQEDHALLVQLPDHRPCHHAWALKIQLKKQTPDFLQSR